jgi:hypothetical protein
MLVVDECVGISDADAVTEVVTLPVVTIMALSFARVPPNGALGLLLFSLFSAALLNALSVSEPWLITPTMPP